VTTRVSEYTAEDSLIMQHGLNKYLNTWSRLKILDVTMTTAGKTKHMICHMTEFYRRSFGINLVK
jgi:hypothetical protein